MLDSLKTMPVTGLLRKVHLAFKYVAILFFAIASWNFISSCWLLYKAERIKGFVVDIVSHTSTNRKSGTTSTSYTPVFEYRYKGELLRHEATFGSGTFTYSMNEEVELLVNPDNGTAKANTFLDLWFLPFMLACVGGFFTLFAVVIPKVAQAFQGFSFASQAFKDMKPGATEETIIIKFKDGKQVHYSDTNNEHDHNN
jgi:hypothetical protein